jgi:hypothetical protein
MGNPTGVRHRFPPGAATAATSERAQNLYSYVAPHHRAQRQQQQHYIPPGYGAEQAFGFQAASSYAGMPFMGQQFDQCQQREGESARKPIRFPAAPLSTQPYQVEAACSWTANCRPELPLDRIQGIFAIAQHGEILTIRAARDGEDWMRLNRRQEEQRWASLNSQIAFLLNSRVQNHRMTFEQFESLVQTTQFLKYLRKTMPMTEAQLDMVTAMHERMWQPLNVLEVFFKGVQRAVNEFNKSTLTGIKKTMANAITKAGQGCGGSGGNTLSAKRRIRRAGGGGGPPGPSYAATAPTQQPGGQALSPA